MGSPKRPLRNLAIGFAIALAAGAALQIFLSSWRPRPYGPEYGPPNPPTTVIPNGPTRALP
jgi:hypothetical protein